MGVRPALMLLLYAISVPNFAASPAGAVTDAQTSATTRGADLRVPDSAKAAMDAADTEWRPAMRRGDTKALARPYAEDAVFLTQDGKSVLGRAAIERLYADRFRSGHWVVDGNLIRDGATVAAGYVYEWGHASMVVARPNGVRSSVDGRYLTVWRRDAQGIWSIFRNLTL